MLDDTFAFDDADAAKRWLVCFCETLRKEWDKLDKYRVDKHQAGWKLTVIPRRASRSNSVASKFEQNRSRYNTLRYYSLARHALRVGVLRQQELQGLRRVQKFEGLAHSRAERAAGAGARAADRRVRPAIIAPLQAHLIAKAPRQLVREL